MITLELLKDYGTGQKLYKKGEQLMFADNEMSEAQQLITEGIAEYDHKTEASIENVKTNIEATFPELWKETEATLSVISAMRLKEMNDPITLILVGAASSGKTTILSFYYNHFEVFKTDNFTPRSFVSHAANVKTEKLEEIDLLPKIKNKTFISPELAPIFGKGKEDTIENFSILARILDGEGFESDSGSKGHRGYKGDYRFTWLGATTPLEKNTWDTMSRIGHRILFINMDNLKKNEDDYVKMFLNEKPYAEKIKLMRNSIHCLLEHIKETELYSIVWNSNLDEELFKKIIKTALLVRLLRAKTSIWAERTQDGDMIYNYSKSLPESPERLISALYNIARGRALLYNRTQLIEEDLELVYRIGFSSMPFDRSDLFFKLLKHGGVMTTETVEKELKCSKATARKVMQTLDILGVVESAYEDLTTKKMSAIELKNEFKWVLKDSGVLRLYEDIRNAYERARKEER